MKRISTLTLLFLVVGFTAFSQTNKVLLIGIDGCRPDALQAANTPNIDALIANAAFTYDAMNDGITISGPGWASLLTGVWPNKHGVTNNSFIGGNFGTYPHLFQRIEEHDPSLNTVSICQWGPVNVFITQTDADVTINVQDHSTYVEEEAVNQLSNFDPDAIFLHFDDVDHAGHGSGFSPDNPDYITAIETVDNSVGGVMSALNNRPDFANENWLIIVSTDHGGIGTSHGGNAFVERNIFMIVSGNSVNNTQVFADSTLTSVPPTSNCLADSVQLYFDGSSVVNTSLNSAFNFGANQDFTVECRVRTNNSGDFAMVTDKDWDSGNNEGWVFSFNVNGGPWKVNVGDGSDRVDLEGNDIADNEWHTLSATFDRDGDLTIYEDGVEVNSGSLSSIDNIYSGFPISFGADNENDYYFTGHIAEVRVFDGLVSSTEIDAWKCMPINNSHPNYSNLLGYWRMADGGGSITVADSSPTSDNGTIDGANWEPANDTLFIWEYDYSNTPKQVDFMVTALEHLCVPIDPNWNLDGNVFGAICSETVNLETVSKLDNILITADNNTDRIVIETDRPGEFILMDATGRILLKKKIASTGISSVSYSEVSTGTYVYGFRAFSGDHTSGKLVLR